MQNSFKLPSALNLLISLWVLSGLAFSAPFMGFSLTTTSVFITLLFTASILGFTVPFTLYSHVFNAPTSKKPDNFHVITNWLSAVGCLAALNHAYTFVNVAAFLALLVLTFLYVMLCALFTYKLFFPQRLQLWNEARARAGLS
ncbi:MAG: hypothetical protein CMF61_05520 [Magnetococcales bacterium]|nr:hypothetical protein [Magnetococcales bacterium]PPR12434.1 MAG: hypothetical protein CFH43_01146 [Pseudomonadota bacterium]|tara:strand:+ start:1706 stop:2134 length:429 start_codon:yes stop_codon:yes gene_type:complete